MFRKFTPGENVSGLNQIKSSVQRGIRAKIAEQFPQLEDEGVLDELMPKKCTMVWSRDPGAHTRALASYPVTPDEWTPARVRLPRFRSTRASPATPRHRHFSFA